VSLRCAPIREPLVERPRPVADDDQSCRSQARARSVGGADPSQRHEAPQRLPPRSPAPRGHRPTLSTSDKHQVDALASRATLAPMAARRYRGRSIGPIVVGRWQALRVRAASDPSAPFAPFDGFDHPTSISLRAAAIASGRGHRTGVGTGNEERSCHPSPPTRTDSTSPPDPKRITRSGKKRYSPRCQIPLPPKNRGGAFPECGR
jgi:hypothetical protein